MARNEGSSLREQIRRDCEDSRNWFDLSGFAGVVDINGHKVTGILQSRRNSRYRRDDMPQGYSSGDMVLFAKCADISNVTAGQQIRVNGVKFTVAGHSVTGHVRRIELISNDP